MTRRESPFHPPFVSPAFKGIQQVFNKCLFVVAKPVWYWVPGGTIPKRANYYFQGIPHRDLQSKENARWISRGRVREATHGLPGTQP